MLAGRLQEQKQKQLLVPTAGMSRVPKVIRGKQVSPLGHGCGADELCCRKCALVLSIITIVLLLPQLDIVKGWKATYIGTHHKTWERMIRDMHRKSKDKLARYTNYVVVCQSSGSGKSRTVTEMMSSIFTIFINLRPEKDSTEGKSQSQSAKSTLLLTHKQ